MTQTADDSPAPLPNATDQNTDFHANLPYDPVTKTVTDASDTDLHQELAPEPGPMEKVDTISTTCSDEDLGMDENTDATYDTESPIDHTTALFIDKAELIKRVADIYARLPANWLTDHVPEVAAAVVAVTCRQDPDLRHKLAIIDPNTTLLHAGTDSDFTIGSPTEPLNTTDGLGRNLFGLFLPDFCRHSAAPTLRLHNLVPAVFAPHAKFVVLGDGTCSGIIGDGYTTIKTIDRLLATCDWNSHLCVTHGIATIRDFDKFDALVFILGANHVGDDPGISTRIFLKCSPRSAHLPKLQLRSSAPPPYIHCLLDDIRQANQQIKLACDATADCRAINSTVIFHPPHDNRKLINPKDNTLTPIGRLRIITAAMHWLPQLQLKENVPRCS